MINKKYLPEVLFLALFIFTLVLFRPIFYAVFFGVLLGYLASPLYQRLVKKMHYPTIIAFLLCFLMLMLILIPGIFISTLLIQESIQAYGGAKQILAGDFLDQCHTTFCMFINKIRADPLFQDQLHKGITGVTTWVIQQATTFILTLPVFIVNGLVLLFTMFYTLRDGHLLMAALRQHFGFQDKLARYLVSRLTRIVKGLVYGYFLIALIQGVLGAIGFALFGLHSPLFWGAIMALLALIPYLGTGFIWGPAAVMIIIEGLILDSSALILKGFGLFLYGLFIVSGIDNLLRPKLLSGAAKVHPLTILLGTLGGVLTLGMVGVIIGPLVLSLLQVLLEWHR